MSANANAKNYLDYYLQEENEADFGVKRRKLRDIGSS